MAAQSGTVDAILDRLERLGARGEGCFQCACLAVGSWATLQLGAKYKHTWLPDSTCRTAYVIHNIQVNLVTASLGHLPAAHLTRQEGHVPYVPFLSH